MVDVPSVPTCRPQRSSTVETTPSIPKHRPVKEKSTSESESLDSIGDGNSMQTNTLADDPIKNKENDSVESLDKSFAEPVKASDGTAKQEINAENKIDIQYPQSKVDTSTDDFHCDKNDNTQAIAADDFVPTDFGAGTKNDDSTVADVDASAGSNADADADADNKNHIDTTIGINDDIETPDDDESRDLTPTSKSNTESDVSSSKTIFDIPTPLSKPLIQSEPELPTVPASRPKPSIPSHRPKPKSISSNDSATSDKRPPRVPKKPSSKIAAFQQMLEKQQQEQMSNFMPVKKTNSENVPKKLGAFAANLNGMIGMGLPGMTGGIDPVAALRARKAELDGSDLEAQTELANNSEPKSDMRRARGKGPKRKAPSSIKKVEIKSALDRQIWVQDIWSFGSLSLETPQKEYEVTAIENSEDATNEIHEEEHSDEADCDLAALNSKDSVSETIDLYTDKAIDEENEDKDEDEDEENGDENNNNNNDDDYQEHHENDKASQDNVYDTVTGDISNTQEHHHLQEADCLNSSPETSPDSYLNSISARASHSSINSTNATHSAMDTETEGDSILSSTVTTGAESSDDVEQILSDSEIPF